MTLELSILQFGQSSEGVLETIPRLQKLQFGVQV